jgi:hypothetical protein
VLIGLVIITLASDCHASVKKAFGGTCSRDADCTTVCSYYRYSCRVSNDCPVPSASQCIGGKCIQRFPEESACRVKMPSAFIICASTIPAGAKDADRQAVIVLSSSTRVENAPTASANDLAPFMSKTVFMKLQYAMVFYYRFSSSDQRLSFNEQNKRLSLPLHASIRRINSCFPHERCLLR